MSDEDFLKRWSRRKREVAKQDEASPSPEPDVVAEAADAAAAGGKTETQFDPASLPPLESINALSDVTAFLRAGVPAELTRAALRRVWTADPTIREFVGLAENAWDFTDPNAMPGFGPLEATEEVRQMIARVVDEIGRSAQPVKENTSSALLDSPESLNNSNTIVEERDEKGGPLATTSTDEPKQNPGEESGNQVLLHSNIEDIASQNDVTEAQEKPKQFAHRTHGRALPQ